MLTKRFSCDILIVDKERKIIYTHERKELYGKKRCN